VLGALVAHLDQQDLVAERRVLQDHAADVVQVNALHDADRRGHGDRPAVVGIASSPMPCTARTQYGTFTLMPPFEHANARRQRSSRTTASPRERGLGVGVLDVVRIVEQQAIGAEAGRLAFDRARAPPAALAVLGRTPSRRWSRRARSGRPTAAGRSSLLMTLRQSSLCSSDSFALYDHTM
jgi:hypothetical protein